MSAARPGDQAPDNLEELAAEDGEESNKLRAALFRNSPEYAEYRRTRRKALWVLGALTAAVPIIYYAFTSMSQTEPVIHPLFILLLSFLLGVYGALLLYLYLRRGASRRYEDRLLLRELHAEEGKLADNSEDGQLDLPGLWAATQKRIDVYHGIATSQAQRSFRVAQIAAIAGFGAVLLLGVLATFATNGTAAIAAAVVGVAGAAMSGYIGATFMKAQAESSKQLRQFFLQPVEFSRMLGAERLINTLPIEQRSAAVQDVVRTMMPDLGANDSETSQEQSQSNS